jgi:DUF1680 family protein
VDGVLTEPAIEKGYGLLWLPAGKHDVEMRMDIKPRWMNANPKAREDVGKVALMLGPCVYCLEETDNGGGLASVFVQPNAAVRETDAGLPGELPTLAYDGQRLSGADWEGKLYDEARYTMEPAALTAVPYCIWGNRKPGEMVVWQKALLKL